ncbi:MAG: hypothetical protein OdinLCB4_006655 [Candidatus Odinarchaeum yellowstonii]|uniref:Uncharacterized protein n=1 Tax=Odinarchaeota yellowstonii (strain LCB_4) TaxID=1841599 RepID=A0AAF0D1X3_ODILC|nr:MAG: hypothetical protein OdinLCB4_006655 [Candidatus Odinarchaeum yellowstonii]
MTSNTSKNKRISMLAEFYGSIMLIIIGAIVTVIVSLFFGGLGFWNIFGFVMIFAGIANIIYALISEKLPNPNSTLRGGLLILFIGLACLISFLPHILLGTLQIMTLILTLIGVGVTVIGVYQGFKK